MKNKGENIKVFVRIKPTVTELINLSKKKQKKDTLTAFKKELMLIEEKITDEAKFDQLTQNENMHQNQEYNTQDNFGSPVSSIRKASLHCSSKQKQFELSNSLKSSLINTKMRVNKECKEDIIIQKIQDNSLAYLKNDKIYEFEGVFDQSQKNQDIFDKIIMPNFDFILRGNNFSVFMYGQTNSGKTYTMKGNKTKKQKKQKQQNNSVNMIDIRKSIMSSKQKLENQQIQISSLKEEGIIQKTLKKLFELLEIKKNCNFRIKIFYYEIYNEKIYDLLSEKEQALKVQENKEGKVFIQNIQEVYIKNYQEALKIFNEGEKRRKFASTKWNHNSSRSHVILSIIIEIKYRQQILKSYFPTITMADLAGSESIGDQKKFSEGGNINKSLLALTTVIKKLNQKKDYIAFRESKLTRILKPFLQGDSRTCVICTINPLKKYEFESLNTLRFGVSAGGVSFNLKDSNLDISQNNKEINEEQQKNFMKEVQIIEQEKQQLQEKYERLDLQLQFTKEQLITIKNELDAKNQLIDQLESQNETTDNNFRELQEQIKSLEKQNQILQDKLKNLEQKQTINIINNSRNQAQNSGNETKNVENMSELENLKKQNQILLKQVHQLNFKINFGSKKTIVKPQNSPSKKRIINSSSKDSINIKKLRKEIQKQEQREKNFIKNEQNLKDLLQKKNEQIKKMSKMISSHLNSEEWF